MKKLFVLFLCLVNAIAYAKGHRSQKAKKDFAKENICPSTGKNTLPCPGYVIDHVKPLACGGVDNPSNMLWQTVEEGKEKDKWERKTCEPPKKPVI